jgi:hypothetical protein
MFAAIKSRFSVKTLMALLIVGLVAIALAVQTLRSRLPLEYKEAVKIFILNNFFPSVEQTIGTLSDTIRTLSDTNVKLNEELTNLKTIISTDLKTIISTAQVTVKSRRKPIDFLGKSMALVTLDIPMITDFYDSGDKPTVFADHHGEDFYLASGDGLFWLLRFSKDLFDGTFTPIPSNFRKITSNLIIKAGDFSIKDILVHDDLLLASYTNEVKEGCFNTSILSAKLSKEYLYFTMFYTYDECIDFKTNKSSDPHEAGGKLSKAWNGGILFSVGDYNTLDKAQNKNSYFGKILYISSDGKKAEIMSLGHRNPQGIVLSPAHGVVVTTEHGPVGGDEINLFSVDEPKPINFGWPISSYGEHGDDNAQHARLYKSHKAYGFREPLIYYSQSIGISRIIECVKVCDMQEKIFIFGSMNHDSEGGRRSINAIQLSDDNKQAVPIQSLKLDQRVRDLRNFDKGMLITTEGSGIPQVSLLIEQ